MLLPDMVPRWGSDGQVEEGSGCCMGFFCSGFSNIASVLLGARVIYRIRVRCFGHAGYSSSSMTVTVQDIER